MNIDPRNYEALKKAIINWDELYKFVVDNEGRSLIKIGYDKKSCPLCFIFSSECCDLCIIRKHTKLRSCDGTPYYKVCRNENSCVASPDLINAVKEEVDFLKMLLNKYYLEGDK